MRSPLFDSVFSRIAIFLLSGYVISNELTTPGNEQAAVISAGLWVCQSVFLTCFPNFKLRAFKTKYDSCLTGTDVAEWRDNDLTLTLFRIEI